MHFSNWQNWNKTHFAGIAAFDSLGNRIYGKEPVWKTYEQNPPLEPQIENNGNSQQNQELIEISRIPQGLMVSLKETSYLKLDLTDALGNFKWSVFEGNLSKGQNIVYLDWNSVDASKTYLVVRLNGAIHSNKLLSTH